MSTIGRHTSLDRCPRRLHPVQRLPGKNGCGFWGQGGFECAVGLVLGKLKKKQLPGWPGFGLDGQLFPNHGGRILSPHTQQVIDARCESCAILCLKLREAATS